MDNAKNLNVLVEESSDKSEIVFLRKIVKGGTDKSYGIYVAKMAGIPNEIINKAKIYLELLNDKDQKINLNNQKLVNDILSKISNQDSNSTNNLIANMKQIDINNISPIEALNILSHLLKKYVK